MLTLPRLPRTALAQQLQGADALKQVLDNPRLDQPLEAVFRRQPQQDRPVGEPAAPTAQGRPADPARRTLEVVPPGWHGQV